jgi:hypothetical protein
MVHKVSTIITHPHPPGNASINLHRSADQMNDFQRILSPVFLLTTIHKLLHMCLRFRSSFQLCFSYYFQALKLARKNLFSRAGSSRPGVAKILVLITSGWKTEISNYKLRMEEENLSLVRANVHRIVIGVGRRVSRRELMGFATTSEDIVMVRSFEDLRRKVPVVRNLLCGSKLSSHLSTLFIQWADL